MDFSTEEKGGVIILTVQGEMVGGPDAALLTERLRDFTDEKKNKIVMNMESVGFMNSSGLGILIGALTTVRNSGGDVKLLHLSKRLQDLIRITKMDRVFDVFENEDEAIGSFS
jgi:anti-sigma B factor antagonist